MSKSIHLVYKGYCYESFLKLNIVVENMGRTWGEHGIDITSIERSTKYGEGEGVTNNPIPLTAIAAPLGVIGAVF